MGEVVLITGVSGYVGSWCANEALDAGYQVVGTVRDPNSTKCAFLRAAIAGEDSKMSKAASSNLTLVAADLLSGDQYWDELFSRVKPKFVLHTA